ncbi:endonuclease/exonuclease/phosphatase family protein [Flavobacterium sandaracinum]|uniref:Endonuclease n=1 Tax=Flavobacterium sandaracinum TaxID=2541733 RepID=A0A4R5D1Y4_9FLAO|nr:endonuclease/exonuclease/phosphatase family protein [Flavobacterium sandaracinum]TDE04285.1 endonuclease [Flavobacterium sandaracinum]
MKSLLKNNRKKIVLFSICLSIISIALSGQTKVVSWNIENIGKSKSDQEIAFIANTVRDFDIIAIQEVVAGYGGAQAVARLADELNRKGAKWDYVISEPTSSAAYTMERYAYIWKTSKVKKIGRAWLEKKYNVVIDREPFLCTFKYKNKEFTLVNFHAIPKTKQPETEIKYFKFLPVAYPTLNLIFVGDFNCPQSHTVFNPLKKMGYTSVFLNQKTTLKRECKYSQCLASELDNMFYNSTSVTVKNYGVVPFYQKFNSLKEARAISDHIPIWAEFVLN